MGSPLIIACGYILLSFMMSMARYATVVQGITWWARWMDSPRVQPTNFPTEQEIRSDRRTTFVTLAIFALADGIALYALLHGYTKIYKEFPGVGRFLGECAALILVHDMYYYFVHRLMHHKKLYRVMHAVHHRHRTPNVWSAFAFHWSETLVQVVFAFAVIWFVPIHTGTLAFFSIWLAVVVITHHSGYELRGGGRTGGAYALLNSTTHHDLHHTSPGYNYALYFPWWDRLFGTEHPRMKTVNERERRMGSWETLADISREQYFGSGDGAIVVRLAGAIDPAMVRQALVAVTNRHPLLRAKIEGRVLKIQRTLLDLPFEVQQREDWQAAVSEVLDFPMGTTPLWRARLVQGANESQLILRSHHAMADGRCVARLAHDMLNHISGIEAIDETVQPVPAPIEALVPRPTRLGFLLRNLGTHLAHKRAESFRMPMDTAARIEDRRSECFFSEFSVERTKALRALARQNGASLHSVLFAASVLARHAISPHDSEDISCFSPVDLRGVAKIDDTSMNCAIAIVSSTHTVDNATDFWTLARECRASLNAAMRKTSVMAAFSESTLRKGIEMGVARADANQSFLYGVLVTNVGEVPVQATYAGLSVRGVQFATTRRMADFPVVVHVATLNGSLQLGFSYSNPIVSRATAERFAAVVQDVLASV